MYARFTDRARKVMQLANQEAQCMKREYIGSEHILLGLVSEGSGVAANVLKSLDVDLRKIRKQIETMVETGSDKAMAGTLPETPRAKKVLAYTIEEARKLGHNYVGTEHLLLGLLRDPDCLAAQVLMSLGLKLEDVHQEVLNILGQNIDNPRAHAPAPEADVDLSKLPAEIADTVRTLDQQIVKLNVDKEIAVARQDFENAADLRDQGDKLRRKMQEMLRKLMQ
jgi:ATP-dependent Clp protease ATP-binding subunit ClpC